MTCGFKASVSVWMTDNDRNMLGENEIKENVVLDGVPGIYIADVWIKTL